MEKYLLHILQEKSRVIIPEFGAIIIKQKNPLKLIFNEFLQYNDGALINHISKEEGIDRDEATRKLNGYVSELRKKLDEGKSIKLKDIGVLSQSSSGKITLEENAQDKTEQVEEVIEESTEESIELETKPEEQEKPEITEKKDKVENEVKEETKQSTNPPVKEKLPEPPKETKKEPVAKKPTQKPQPKARVEFEDEKPKSPIPKVEKNVEPPVKTYYANTTNKRKKIILFLVALFVVNAMLIVLVLYPDEVKSIFSKETTDNTEIQLQTPEEEQLEQTETINATTIDDGTSEDQMVTEDEDIPEVVEQEYYSIKYYVVAGVFGIESNADKLVEELRERGYQAEKFGKIGDMYAVCYDVFPTKPEADTYLREIHEREDPEAWIRVVN